MSVSVPCATSVLRSAVRVGRSAATSVSFDSTPAAATVSEPSSSIEYASAFATGATLLTVTSSVSELEAPSSSVTVTVTVYAPLSA